MAKSNPQLHYSRSGRRTRRAEVRALPFRIGSGPDCELRVDAALVSPLHAVLEADGAGFRLVNRSVNGTRLEGQPIRGARALVPGQRIEIGEDVSLELRLPESKATRAPRKSVSASAKRTWLWIGLGAYAFALAAGGIGLSALASERQGDRATPTLARDAARDTQSYLVEQGHDEAQADALAHELDELLFRAWRLEAEGRVPGATAAYRDVIRLVPSLRAPTTQLAARQLRRIEEDER